MDFLVHNFCCVFTFLLYSSLFNYNIYTSDPPVHDTDEPTKISSGNIACLEIVKMKMKIYHLGSTVVAPVVLPRTPFPFIYNLLYGFSFGLINLWP